jgi:hypothetical protein
MQLMLYEMLLRVVTVTNYHGAQVHDILAPLNNDRI